MSDEVEVTYSTAFPELAALLANVKRPGDFYASGIRETILPGITVEGVGPLSFPLPASQARELIHAAAERAPYGRGSETLVDETVRKVWQIAPEKVTLAGKGWTATLQEIVQQSASALGCTDAKVEAEFYKLLVYDEGGFFTSHRDSEKTGGMFGTLVVSLPSAHEGGTLTIRHAGRESRLDLCPREPGEIRYAAFYADCEHEVSAITSGYRLCLIYNLVQRAPRPATMTAPDHREVIHSAAQLLRQWTGKGSAPPHKLVYLLEHHYTQAGLSFASLKNGDSALATVLKAAAQEAECDLHLGIVHIEESGSAEYYGSHYDDEDGSEDDYEMGEIYDRNEFLSDWRNVDDQPADLGSIPLEENELLPEGALDEEKPDKTHFSEATGNAGAEFERTYLRAALILWPRDRINFICLSGGLDAAVSRFEVVARQLGNASPETAGPLLRSLYQILEHIADGGYQGGKLDQVIQGLTASRSSELIQRTFDSLILPHYDGSQNEALLACVKTMPGDQASAMIRALILRHAGTRPARCMHLWNGLAKQPHLQHVQLASSLTAGLKTATQPALRPIYPYHSEEGAYTRPDKEGSLEKARLQAETDGSHINARLLADFLTALHALDTPALIHDAIAAMVTNPATFAPDHLLLRSLEMLLAEPQWQNSLPLAALWHQCATQLLQRSETPPPAPATWTDNTSIPGRTEEARELAAFAKDPAAVEHRFRVRQEVRYQLLDLLRECDLEMEAVTDRKGRPQTLVVTKTRAAHGRAVALHRADQARMRRLLGLARSHALLADTELLQRVEAAASAS